MAVIVPIIAGAVFAVVVIGYVLTILDFAGRVARLWQRYVLKQPHPLPATTQDISRVEAKLEQLQKMAVAPPPGAPPVETHTLAAQATKRTDRLLAEAIELQHQHKERDAIERLLTAYDMDMPPSAKVALHNLAGNGFARLSEFEEAEGQFHQLLAAADAGNDSQGKSIALGNIAAVHAEQGHLDQAKKELLEVLSLDRKGGHRVLEAATLNNLGVVYRKLALAKSGDERGLYINQAEMFLTQALTAYQGLANQGGVAAALGNLGILSLDQLQFEQARDYYSKALTVARQIGDRSLEAKQLGNIGTIYTCQSRFTEAIEHHEAALAIDRDIQDVLGEAQDLGNLGTAYRDKGDVQVAQQCYSQALDMFQQVGARFEAEQCKRLLNALPSPSA